HPNPTWRDHCTGCCLHHGSGGAAAERRDARWRLWDRDRTKWAERAEWAPASEGAPSLLVALAAAGGDGVADATPAGAAGPRWRADPNPPRRRADRPGPGIPGRQEAPHAGRDARPHAIGLAARPGRRDDASRGAAADTVSNPPAGLSTYSRASAARFPSKL